MEVAKRSGQIVTTAATKTQMRLLIDEYLSLSVGLARNTIAQRRSQAQNWLLPKRGDWPIGGVTEQAVEQWIEDMRKAGAGGETIRKCPQLLVSVMYRAVDHNLITRNPATGA